MKVSLLGLILNEPQTRDLLSVLLKDKEKPVPADIALDYLIQEYVNLRLGGTSPVVKESSFPDRKFELNYPEIKAS